MHRYHLEALHAVLDVPLDQGLQLVRLQGGGAWGLALQALVPGHHIIAEEHTQDVSNAAVMRHTGLHSKSCGSEMRAWPMRLPSLQAFQAQHKRHSRGKKADIGSTSRNEAFNWTSISPRHY